MDYLCFNKRLIYNLITLTKNAFNDLINVAS